jgi:hypothetical protein
VLRETTTVTLSAELYSQASALFGLAENGLAETPVLTQIFNDVDLVGHPLTIGNFVSQQNNNAVTFSVRSNTYSPYFALGDVAFDSTHDQIIRGQDYQEILSTFPLSTQVLTGLFLDITLSGPAGADQTYSRALFDRIGYAPRQGLVGTNVTIDPSGPAAISNFDVFTLNILASTNSPTPLGMLSSQVQQEVNNLPDLQSSDDSAVASEPFVRDLDIATTRLLANQYLTQADAHASQTATAAGVIAYYDRPRIVLTSNRVVTDPTTQASGLMAKIDLVKETMRIIPVPGQPSMAATFFNTVRGIYNNITERDVIANLQAPGQTLPIQNTMDIFDAAVTQGIGFTAITLDSLATLDTLNIPDEAKARIATEVQSGYLVMVPDRNVVINGVPTIAWAELDSQTGEFIGVTQDGGHDGLFEFFALGAENLEVQKELNEDLGGILEGFFVGSVLGLQFQLVLGITGSPRLAKQELDAQKEQAQQFVDDLEKSGLIDTLVPSLKVAEFVSDIAKDGVGAKLSKTIGDDIKALVRINFEQMLSNTVKGLTGEDPPFNPFLSNLQPPAFLPTSLADESATFPATTTGGAVTGTVQTPSVAVEGSLTASWATTSVSSLNVATLTANGASITDGFGNAVGSGVAMLGLNAPITAALSGNNQYSVSGTGNLSFYGAAEVNLGVTGEWDNYSATVSAVTGLVSIKLTTDGLKLNGQTLPAGTYTITAAAAAVGGSGASSSPSFAGAATLNATGGTIILGAGTGAVMVGGQSQTVAQGLSLTGYTGSIAVAAGSANLDSFTLNGTAAQLLRISANPSSLTTDQNTPVNFQLALATSLTDAYSISVQAPTGWTVAVDTTGKVTVTPAPGLQSGSFPILVVARSTVNPSLVTQCEVNVTVTATQPGVTLAFTPDPMLTVLFHGAEIPTAYQATIHNTGPTAETFNLTFPTLPTGFTIETSVNSVTVPAGQTGIIGVYLLPSGLLPAPGAPVSFSVTATSGSDSNIVATKAVSFSMPTIHSITVTANPTDINTIPNAAISTTFTFQNTGNVQEQVTLASVLPNGLTLTNVPAFINLAPGATTTVVGSFKSAAGTPINTTLTGTLYLTYGAVGSLINQAIDVPVHVVVPGAQDLARAALSADQIGNQPLGPAH